MKSSRIYKAEGIVLKRRNVGEADRLLTLFTKQKGKIKVLVKGVRKVTSRRAGHIEVFSHSFFTIHTGKTMDTVSEASHARGSTFSDKSLTNISYAYYLCELVDQLLPENQEHVDIFFLLRDTLVAVSSQESEDQLQTYIHEFTHRMLWMLGYLQPLHRMDPSRLRPFVESITERKSKTLLLLTKLHAVA